MIMISLRPVRAFWSGGQAEPSFGGQVADGALHGGGWDVVAFVDHDEAVSV
jgi:hypothetical protein